MHLHAARHEDLVVTEAPDGILVYDNRSHHIHHLNAAVSAIWRLCDGARTPHEIATTISVTSGTNISVETVTEGLILLASANLLDQTPATQPSAPRQSRRRLLKRAAVAGAVPAIVSVTAANAGASQSDPLPNCTPAGDPCTPGPVNNCCDTVNGDPTSCRVWALTPDGEGGYIEHYRCEIV